MAAAAVAAATAAAVIIHLHRHGLVPLPCVQYEPEVLPRPAVAVAWMDGDVTEISESNSNNPK